MDLAAAAFEDDVVASDWASMAAELDRLYCVKGPETANETAKEVCQLMTAMAKLLPHAYCKAVQKVTETPFLAVDLMTTGHFVYCLVSPYMRKLYCGAVGFKQ